VDRHGPIDAMLELLPPPGSWAWLRSPTSSPLASPRLSHDRRRGCDRLSRPACSTPTPGSAPRARGLLDKGGGHVSVGRDVGKLLDYIPGVGSQTGKHGEGWIAGALDAIADLGADPLAQLGHLRGEALSAEGPAGRGVLNKIWGGLGVANVEKAFDQYPRFRQAVNQLSTMSNEGDIVRRYGENLAPIAGRLAKAENPSEVMTSSGASPTRTRSAPADFHPLIHTHPVPGRLQRCSGPDRQCAAEDRGQERAPAQLFDPETMSFSSKSFAAFRGGHADSGAGDLPFAAARHEAPGRR